MQGKKGKKIEKPNMADLLLLSKSGEGKKKRLTMVQNFMNNRHLIEEFFGRPIDSSYFSPNMFKAQLRSGTQGALFDEQIADLSALEQLTGKSLTRDKEMRKLLFPDDRSAEVYDAITGYRQTRLDSKDLPPYTPVSPEEPGMLDRLKGLFGKKEGGDVSNEDFIRQMTVGTPSSDQEADPDVVKDIVRGVQYTPFDVLGAPVDIATMVMRPLGYNVEKPVGGSDYFIDQAAKLGLFKPSTGSGAELLGRIAGGGATPALARGVSKVAGATEDFISNQLKGRADRRVIQEAAAKVPPDTAYDPLRDRMEQIGALTYAIKPKGGNVVSQNIQTSLDNIRPMMAVPGEGVLPPSRMFASSYAARLKDQIEKSRQAGDPTAYLEGKLSAVEPNAALDNWIQTKLSKYVRTDMGSEADPVRKLAEEMSTKVKADYEVGLKRIAKMKSDIAKAKAKNKNTDASETTLAAEIEKVEGAFRQTSLLPAALGPYTHPALRTAENREMAGFSPYPISKTNLGKEWEEIADMEFRPHKAGDLVKTNSLAFQENPWIGNLNPDEIVYTVDPYIYQKPMFTHTVDELKNALDPASGLPQRLQLKPEDMQQLSIDKAFRLVNNINDWRLEQRIALNLEEANRAAVTVKQYPGSPGNLQWQEIKAPTYTELPPGYTIEKLDDATSVLKGPDGKSLTYFGATDGPASNHQKEALSFLSKNDLERALKYEGSTMRHCVGGYCDDVWSGRTRTYSLRDSKGEPHVTIETAPADIRRNGNTPRDFIDSLGLENLSEFSSRYGIDKNEINNLFYKDQPLDTVQVSRKIIASPEFQQWLKSRPDEILQIKGKANVLSGKWSSVGDIRNAELNKLDRGGKLLRELSEEGYDISKIPQYVTDEELKELMKILMNFDSNRALKKLDKKAAGGEVSNADFIRNRQEGSPQEGEVANDDFIQQMMTGTPPTNQEADPDVVKDIVRGAQYTPFDLLGAPVDIATMAIRPFGYNVEKPVGGSEYFIDQAAKLGLFKPSTGSAAELLGRIGGGGATPAIARGITKAADATGDFISGQLKGRADRQAVQQAAAKVPPDTAYDPLRDRMEQIGALTYAVKPTPAPVAQAPKNQMGFYSAVEDTILRLPQEKGTAQQFLAQISKAPGVKQGEIKATGLEDFLKSKGTGPVTKEEVRSFLDSNKVQVDEVVLGAGKVLSTEAKRLSDAAFSRMEEADNKMAPFFEQMLANNSTVGGQEPYSTFYRIRGPLAREIANGDQDAVNELYALNLPPEVRQAALDYASAKQEYQLYTKQARKMEKPKFGKYNIPGGTNPREIYLTLPGSEGDVLSAQEIARLNELGRKRIGSSLDGLSPPEQSEYFSLIDRREKAGSRFTVPGSHSVSPEADKNRVAHIFLDDRTDAQGNKVLFVQEMQSDWAKTGRDKGFVTKQGELPVGWGTFQDKKSGDWYVVDKTKTQVGVYAPTKEEAIFSATVGSNKGIPSAPFVTSTEDWVNLSLKRVINEAVENGYDKVAFIKGEQAADKYSLRTFVDQITADRGFATGDDLYVSITPKNSLSPHAFYVGPDGAIKEPISADVRSKFLGKPLSEVIGKEAAEKLLSTKIGESQTLKEEGLAFGGQGMKGFYDNVLPKTANKLLEKLGSKIEPVVMEKEVPSRLHNNASSFLDWMGTNHPGTSRSDAAREWAQGMDGYITPFVKEYYEATKPMEQLGFKITPEMIELVKTKGLPQFAKGGEVSTKDFIQAHA
jgi:hypothetical protein